ncbi:MAG: hypothetical protein PHP50_09975 [Lachnospiraceae bacterium]|nr:hypothetical protein [Lachnospiraceae bacterium]
MKHRKKWAIFVGILIILAIFIFSWIDGLTFMGVRTVSAGGIEDLIAGKQQVVRSDILDELLYFNGDKAAFDKDENTFYIGQSQKHSIFEGTISCPDEATRIYIVSDDYMKLKKESLAESHSFQLYFVAEDYYTKANLVFVGSSIMSLKLDDGMTFDPATERIAYKVQVYAPDDQEMNYYTIKNTQAAVRYTATDGRISLRIYNKEYTDTKQLSLLGMTKTSNWSLYPVSDTELTGSRLAGYVWNSLCSASGDSNYESESGYVEVFINNSYQGLYLLGRAVSDRNLYLTAGDYLYQCKTDAYPTADNGYYGYEAKFPVDDTMSFEPLTAYADVFTGKQPVDILDQDNFISYDFFTQITCSVKSGSQYKYLNVI